MISSYVIELLNDDMMSHGFLVQCVAQNETDENGPQLNWRDVLEDLLSREVEIGDSVGGTRALLTLPEDVLQKDEGQTED